MEANRLLKYLLALLTAVSLSCSSNEKKEENVSQNDSEGMRLPAGEVTYEAPAEWIAEQPSSGMRKAQFQLPGSEGAEAAELAVFFFPGTGGSVQANLERWYGQFKQTDGSAITSAQVKTHKEMVDKLPVTTVYLSGIYLKPQSPMMMGGPVDEMPDYAMLAAIAETAGGPWFFKATGPQATIERWRPNFAQFVKTFRVKS